MLRVERNKSVSQLLALCFAALFLTAQTQASAHIHDDGGDAGASTECALCIVGSQIDDAVSDDGDHCIVSPAWASQPPAPENLTAQQFLTKANARAPPVS